MPELSRYHPKKRKKNMTPDNVRRPAKRSSSGAISFRECPCWHGERSEIGVGKTKIAKPRDEQTWKIPVTLVDSCAR